MKKRFFIALLTVNSVMFLSACAGKVENTMSNGKEDQTVAVSTENQNDAHSIDADSQDVEISSEKNEEYEYPSEEHTSEVWESELGYSMTYDPSVFTVDDTGDSDIFTYNTAEKLEAPVYISVQKYTDMDAMTLAEGLALQSGIDGVEVQEAYFGAEGLETQNVYVEKNVDGVKQIQIFYTIPQEKGSLLVEIGNYAGVSTQIDSIHRRNTGDIPVKTLI